MAFELFVKFRLLLEIQKCEEGITSNRANSGMVNMFQVYVHSAHQVLGRALIRS